MHLMALSIHDAVYTTVGMVVITLLLIAGISPVSSERVFRFLCVLAAMAMFILVLEHS